MTVDTLIPDLLALIDLDASSVDAHTLRWKILTVHGVTQDCPASTYAWALSLLPEMSEDALSLNWLRQGLIEPADVSPELGRRPSDYECAENLLLHMLECAQDNLRLAGLAAELMPV